ncbi:hypothetical protein Tco_1166477 [Tanacetum coccineum]
MKEKGTVHFGWDTPTSVKGIYVYNKEQGLVPQRQKASDYDNPDPAPELQNVSPSADTTVPSQQELDLLFGPLYDEFFNDGTSRVNKSSSPTDNSAPQDTLPSTNIHPTTEPSTPTNVHAEENNDNQAEFTNPFCTPVQEHAESSSRNIGNSNVHTFNQPQDSEYRWTKDHPLTQVRGNPSKPVQTRRQLATDPEMCMFALTVSIVEPKNIKEAMADSAWIEAMQEELHQFDRLQVWELVDKPFGKNVIKLKWLWKNKKDEDQTVIATKPVCSKGFALESTSGGIQFLGDKLVSWISKKQDCTAMSSAEAEYVTLSASCAQVMWTRTHTSLPKQHPYSGIHLHQGKVENALSEDTFQYLVRRIGMRCLTPAELEGRMPTKIELTLEKSQQGVSNDVLENELTTLIRKISKLSDSEIYSLSALMTFPVNENSKHGKSNTSVLEDPTLWKPGETLSEEIL